MMTARLFFLDGMLAFRALFRWLAPSVFLPTVLGAPAGLLLLFVVVGDHLGSRPPSYYALGTALHASAVAGLFATAMCVTNERAGRTLSILLASPANRLVVFAGRTVGPALTGLLTSVVMLGLGHLVGGLRVPAAGWPPLLLAMLATAVASSTFGLALGAIGLRGRDALVLANMSVYLMLLLCGIVVPVAELSGPLRAASAVLPMTHGVQAARNAAAGLPVTGPLLAELAVGAAYLVLAAVLLRWCESSSRRLATLDLG